MERPLLLVGGIAFLLVGAVLLAGYFFTPSYLGPVFRVRGATVYFPIGLSIVLSIVLTVLLNLLLRAR